jgi:uncharacterized delta-60 repeat protein
MKHSSRRANAVWYGLGRRAAQWRLVLTLLLVGSLVPWQLGVSAADSDLDQSFDLDGKVTTDFFGSYDSATTVLIQPNGKIVAVGSAQGGGDFAAVRYDSFGTPDPAFGNGGRVAINFGGGIALDGALQPDGKIVVVGRANSIDPTADFGLVRFDTQGNPDPAFGIGGKVATDFAGDFDAATGVAIQSDGKIVVAGRATIGGNADFAVARYDANGVLDPTFGMGGKATLDFFGGKDGGADVAIQKDGKIVLASDVQGLGSQDFGVARFTASGVPDALFGNGGKATLDFAGGPDNGTSVALQSDGKIVVAGTANNYAGFAAARFNTEGTPDAGFGIGGKVVTTLNGIANDLAVQSDGKIVLAGTTDGTGLDFGLVRLNNNGTPDAGFGNGGNLLTDFFGNDDGSGAVAIQPDGKIIVGGFANLGGETDVALARYGTGSVGCPAITLTPATLPNGIINTAYNATLAANPVGSYSYAVTTNILPPGLTLNGTIGAITGIPTASGNFTFGITATAANGCAGTQAYNLLITANCAAITVNPASLPAATVGVAYNQTITATGGNAPYSFAVTSGTLPTGLLLDGTTGAITGTPTAGGTFIFRITATGAGGCTGSRNYVMTLACSTLTFTPPILSNAQVGVNYNKLLTVSPAGSYTFSLLTGQLPPGITLNSAGLISGVSSQAGTYNFKVKALAAGGCLGTKSYALMVTNYSF